MAGELGAEWTGNGEIGKLIGAGAGLLVSNGDAEAVYIANNTANNTANNAVENNFLLGIQKQERDERISKCDNQECVDNIKLEYQYLDDLQDTGLEAGVAIVTLGVGSVLGWAGRAIGLGGKIVTTGAESSIGAINLGKSLASEAQIGEAGTIIAGKGSDSVFRGAKDAARKYGGKAEEWVKKSSTSYTAKDGVKFETHWVENLKTGERVEFKTNIDLK